MSRYSFIKTAALAALQGSQVIIHAGDIGTPEVIDRLREVAPTYAVRGNNDTQAWASTLPIRTVVEAGEHRICVLHQVAQLYREPLDAGCAAVVFGHTHKPLIETRNGVLYINPGSAGPRRFSLPVTVARLRVTGTSLEPEIVDLDV